MSKTFLEALTSVGKNLQSGIDKLNGDLINAIPNGYSIIGKFSGDWDSQGIGTSGDIQNITNVSCIGKSTPINIDRDFKVIINDDNYRLNIVEYTYNGGSYTYKKGTQVTRNNNNIEFNKGYYKIGFEDITSNQLDYYNMSPDNRKTNIESHYDVLYVKIQYEHIKKNMYEIVNRGYFESGTIDCVWDPQGLGSEDDIQNITPVAHIRDYITFDKPFRVNSISNTVSIRVLKYTNEHKFIESKYLLNESHEFENGVYRFSITDTTNTIDYYNMSATNRTNMANTYYSIDYNLINYETKTTKNDVFEKPFVMFSFDWYSDSWQKYQIMHPYGMNATFCLDGQTENYELNSGLTREQFNTMIENGWDYAPYGTIGDRGTTKDSWKQAILNLLNQKEAIGIFNPVMYNTPDNNSSSYITEACKELGFLLQRCFEPDTNNFIKSKNQYRTGAYYLTNDSLENCKSYIDSAIANGWGVCFYAHNMSDSSDLSVASFTNFIQYVNSKVQNGDLEVLSARDYVYKYLTDKAMSNDYKASVKLQAFLHV